MVHSYIGTVTVLIQFDSTVWFSIHPQLAYERKLTALKDKLQEQPMPTSIAAYDAADRTGQLFSSEASVPPSSNSFGRQRESVIQLESVASSRGES